MDGRSDSLAEKLEKCVVNDYFTPNIKAEVILDALLTPYAAEIVNWKCGLDTRFVTKEMSVLDTSELGRSPQYGNRGTKIDYILADLKSVYLVELKTTDGSIKTKQAQRYLDNCVDSEHGRVKTFGEVFGGKLLDIMANETGVSPKGTGPFEERLWAMFHDILKKYGSAGKSKNCAEYARALLVQKGWGGTRKYLYTMGQLLDYIYPADGGFRPLGELPLRLIYLTPTGMLPHKAFEQAQDFYQGSISLPDAGNYLSEKREDELAQLLANIIGKIYGK